MPKTKATISDIARAAGVSPSTVSRVLNEREYLLRMASSPTDGIILAAGGFEEEADPDEVQLLVKYGAVLVGIGDIPAAQDTDPPLTTVTIPLREVGCQAMEQVFRQLGGEPPTPRSVPTTLTIRQSTARPGPIDLAPVQASNGRVQEA